MATVFPYFKVVLSVTAQMSFPRPADFGGNSARAICITLNLRNVKFFFCVHRKAYLDRLRCRRPDRVVLRCSAAARRGEDQVLEDCMKVKRHNFRISCVYTTCTYLPSQWRRPCRSRCRCHGIGRPAQKYFSHTRIDGT